MTAFEIAMASDAPQATRPVTLIGTLVFCVGLVGWVAAVVLFIVAPAIYGWLALVAWFVNVAAVIVLSRHHHQEMNAYRARSDQLDACVSGS